MLEDGRLDPPVECPQHIDEFFRRNCLCHMREPDHIHKYHSDILTAHLAQHAVMSGNFINNAGGK